MTETLLPYPVLPLSGDDAALPQLTKDTLVLVVGGRGIAAAVARQFHRLGARVAVTTRDRETYDRSLIPEGVGVFELDYTQHEDEEASPKHFVRRYVEYYGRVWDIRHDGAMTVYAGDLLDYTENEIDTCLHMLITGPAMLERTFFEQADKERLAGGPQRKYITCFGMSTAAFTEPPFFQPLYNVRHNYVWRLIVGRNASLKRPEMLYLGVACTFTDTEWLSQAINPSATAGDKAQIAYMEVTGKMTPLLGVAPEVIGEAVAQAVLLREKLQQETIFVVPDKGGAASQAGTARLAQMANLSGKHFTEAYTDYVVNVFKIPLQEH